MEIVQDAFGVRQYLAVPEPDDSIAQGLQILGSFHIIGIVGMLTAVDLDDNHPLATAEICDVGADRKLPDELQTAKLPAR